MKKGAGASQHNPRSTTCLSVNHIAVLARPLPLSLTKKARTSVFFVLFIFNIVNNDAKKIYLVISMLELLKRLWKIDHVFTVAELVDDRLIVEQIN